MLLRIVFLSGLISAPLYSSQAGVNSAGKTCLETYLACCSEFRDDSSKRTACYHACVLTSHDEMWTLKKESNKIALERLEVARQQLKATEEQNKLIAALLALSLSKQPLAPSITPILHSTATAPAPSAPPAAALLANPMQLNQMPPDHKSSQLTKG